MRYHRARRNWNERILVRYLVTGATGFIGLHLVRALVAAGHEVTCLVRRTSRVDALRQPAVDFVEGDVESGAGLAEAVVGRQAVFHLAGSIKGIRRADFFRTNCDGVRQVVEAAARQSSPPAVVIASSIAAAGPCVGNRLLQPGDEARPVSFYGESKLAGERAAQQFAADVPISVIRAPIVFGSGDRVSFEWFRSIAKFRLHFVPGFRAARFSLVHVDDAVSAFLAAAERGRRLLPATDSDTSGRGCYYVAADEMPTYGEIGSYVASSLGITWFRTVRVPTLALKGAALAGECAGRLTGKPPFLGLGKVREASAGSWVCCTETARRELEFRPAQNLAERFAATADWYREKRWL